MENIKKIGNKYYEELGFLMLRTQRKSCIFLDTIDNKLMLNKFYDVNTTQNIDFYLTSDEKIQLNDWYTNGTYIFQCTDLSTVNQERYNYLKKIVATTDDDILLPKLYIKDIEFIIEVYKNGNIINKLLVEYEECSSIDKNLVKLIKDKDSHDFEFQKGLRLKVNSDNRINIKPIKKTWNREELPIDSLITLSNSLNTPIFKRKFNKNGVIMEAIKELDKWIENNL